MSRTAAAALVAVVLTFGTAGCREEGPAEKAGKKVDEMVDRLRHGDEGDLEKAGRKLGEAVDDAVRETGEALEDLGEEIQGD
ncbi:MAG: hypothetical protein GY937_07430 [bacterium]|nr:hypothetical protein [bacterium]